MCARDSGLGDSRRIEVSKEGMSFVGQEDMSFVGQEDRSGYAEGTLSPNSAVVQHWPMETMGLEAGGSVWTVPAY